MESIIFLPTNFQFLELKFPILLNRRVFVMEVATLPELFCSRLEKGTF